MYPSTVSSATTWMTCCIDGLEHAITDNDLTTGQQRGIYGAVCGHRVASRALICPPGRRCPICLAVPGGQRLVARRDAPG